MHLSAEAIEFLETHDQRRLFVRIDAIDVAFH